MIQVFSWYCGGGYNNRWLGHCDLLFPQASAGSRLLGTMPPADSEPARVSESPTQGP